MREKINWGKATIYLNDKKIDVTGTTSLKLDDTELTETDAEPCKYGAKRYTLTFELGIHGDNPLATSWYRRLCNIGREQKKALLYAVTHGYKVLIPFKDDGEVKVAVLLTPRMINMVFKNVSWLQNVFVFDEYYTPYVIRKGKLKPNPVWPLTNDMLEAYTERLMKYKVED